MKQKKTTVILGIAIVLGLLVFGGFSTDYFNLVSTNAQQSPGGIFALINEKAKQNNSAPTFTKSEELVGLVIEGFSVFDLPGELQDPLKEQVATASLNGLSGIDENNVVAAVNNLAAEASAPGYAYTNVEQVKVVRTFMNRLTPDLVSASGPMTDIEAFAVFIATMSQKVDNDAFMVTPAEFTANLASPVNQPFPGSSAAAAGVSEASQESSKMSEMQIVVDSYVNSKRRLPSSSIISTIGIQ